MPQFHRADRTDARGSQMNDIAGSQHNHSKGSVHNDWKVGRSSHSTNKRYKNTYSTAIASKDKSWRPTYNTGSTYYYGFNSGSTISGDMNNIFTSDSFTSHRGMDRNIGQPYTTSDDPPVPSQSQTESIPPFNQQAAQDHTCRMPCDPQAPVQQENLSHPVVNTPEELRPDVLQSHEGKLASNADTSALEEKFATELQAASGDIDSVVESLLPGTQEIAEK